MRICVKCGTHLDNAAGQCNNCGSAINSLSQILSTTTKLLLIGRHPESDIILDRDGVHPFHAVLWMDKAGVKHIFFPPEHPNQTKQSAIQTVTDWSCLRVAGDSMTTEVISESLKHARNGVICGRSPNADLTIKGETVSWNHLAIIPAVNQENSLIAVDLGSTNGSFSVSRQLGTRRFNWQILDTKEGALSCGSASVINLRQLLGVLSSPKISAHPNASRAAGRFRIEKDCCILGREETADLSLPFPQISRRHMEIRKTNTSAYLMRDLESTNGTFVDGKKIKTETFVTWGSQFRIGPVLVCIDRETGDLLFDRILGSVNMRAMHLCQTFRDTQRGYVPILRDISFSANAGELVAVMGPSGSGKSTLINLLNGYDSPSSGEVLINDTNIIRHFDEFRDLLGYVPQDDILHTELTVWETLYFKARLRLPHDLSTEEIDSRINEVLSQLDITSCRDLKIGSARAKTLSGGQRKRANLASELITDPPVLILDEPTSGLSSQDAFEIIHLLRAQANQGRTIIITIHQPSSELYAKIDKTLYLAPGGYQAFFGKNIPDSLDYFSVTSISPDAILKRISALPPADWAKRFAGRPPNEAPTKEHQRSGGLSALKHIKPSHNSSALFSLHQLITLIHRNVQIKLSDTRNLFFMALQAPLIGFLIAGLYSDTTSDLSNRAESLFIICIASIFFGAFNAAREFTSEREIFKRERMGNLQVAPYALSKFLPLFAFGMIQAVVFSGMGKLFLNLQGSFFLYWIILSLTIGTTTALGLLISAAAKSAETAMAVVPVVLIFHIILGGYLHPLNTREFNLVTALSTPMTSRWSTDALFEIERKGLAAHGQSVADVLQAIDRAIYRENPGDHSRDKLKDEVLKEMQDALPDANPQSKAEGLIWQETVQKPHGFIPNRLARALGVIVFYGMLYLLVSIFLLSRRSSRS